MIKKSANYNRIIHNGKVHLFPYLALRDHYAVEGYPSSYVLSIASVSGGMRDSEDVCVFCSMMVHDPTSPRDNPVPLSRDFARGLFHRVNGDGGTVDLGHIEVFRAIASLLTFDGVEVMVPVMQEAKNDLGFEGDWVPFRPDSVLQCILVLSDEFLADPLEHAINFDSDENQILQLDEIIRKQEDENALIGPKERRDRKKHEDEIRKMVREEREREDQIRIGQMIDFSKKDTWSGMLDDDELEEETRRSGSNISFQKEGIPNASLDKLSKSLGYPDKSRKQSPKIKKNRGYFAVSESS